MFQSIIPAHNNGCIAPEEIPNPSVPLNETEHILNNAITHKNRELREGTNMFVSLLTGIHLVGQVEWVDADHFTVGQSKPIPDALIESAREV